MKTCSTTIIGSSFNWLTELGENLNYLCETNLRFQNDKKKEILEGKLRLRLKCITFPGLTDRYFKYIESEREHLREDNGVVTIWYVVIVVVLELMGDFMSSPTPHHRDQGSKNEKVHKLRMHLITCRWSVAHYDCLS